jgi:septum formation protein
LRHHEFQAFSRVFRLTRQSAILVVSCRIHEPSLQVLVQPSFLVLASASPRRKHLLRQIGLVFDCIPSGVDETISTLVTPEEHVLILAERKARDVGFKLPAAIVIGADTIVVHDDEIINKPTSEDDAVRILHRLSDQRHDVYTGFSLVEVPGLRVVTKFERTEVWFRKLGTTEILDYVRSGSPMDKAGAYGIQDDFGAVFVRSIVGDFYNVMGLPLSNFYCTYREFTKIGATDELW